MPFKPLVNFKSDNIKQEFASIDPSLKQALSSAPGYAFITSGKRDSGTNKSVGGVQNSFHLTGQAVDLRKRETSASTLQYLKGKGYQIIDEGDHYHVEPAGKPMPFKPLSAPTGQPDLEALGKATATPVGLQMTGGNVGSMNIVNPKVKNAVDASNVDATTKARALAEQAIKESIDTKLMDALEKAAAAKGTTFDKLSRQDFQIIGKGNSKEAGELYDRLNPKPTAEKIFSAGEREKLSGARDALTMLKRFTEMKNSGLSGEGIDTGPIVGGAIGDFVPFMKEGYGRFVPSGMSPERATLRLQEKNLLVPVRKFATGLAGGEQGQAREDIAGTLPRESDNDEAFFNNSFEAQRTLVGQIKNLLDTAKKAGIDTADFADLEGMDADQMAEELRQSLMSNPKGSYKREFPNSVPFKSGQEQSDGLKNLSTEELLKQL